MKKILIPLLGDDVAPRFDLAPEAVVATLDDGGTLVEERTIVLPSASSEVLCRVVLDERTNIVVCGGIDEEYYQYLNWKKVKVIDSVIGPYGEVFRRLGQNKLQAGDIIRPEDIELS
jgi:predicted Fe-Mo cluster-binding NifX family protein